MEAVADHPSPSCTDYACLNTHSGAKHCRMDGKALRNKDWSLPPWSLESAGKDEHVGNYNEINNPISATEAPRQVLSKLQRAMLLPSGD